MRSILALLCISCALFAKDINIATYNVENLFDGVNQGTEYRDFRLGNNGWNEKIAKKKFENTAQAIKLIGADIIALQEVENDKILKALAKKTGFKYMAFAKTYRAPVGVGILSNYPIITSKAKATGVKKTKDFLYTKIDINGHSLGLWVVHFPTQKYPISQRKRVALALKKAVQKVDDSEYLIVGDFNTNISKNSILQQTFGAFSHQNTLYEPWFSLPSNERWSYAFFNKKSALDRMLLNGGLFDGKNLEFKKNSFRVVKNSFLLNHRGLPNRWQMRGKKRYKTHQGEGYSDHLPLFLTLTTNKQANPQEKGDIDKLFGIKSGKCDILIEKAVVIYKHKKGVILGREGRGIYIHKPGFELKKSYMYDVVVKGVKDYKGNREISSLEVVEEHGKVEDLSPYYFDIKNFSKAREGDVVAKAEGKIKGKYLYTKYGKILLFMPYKKGVKDGKNVKLEQIRVGKYYGKNELIVEERE